MSRAPIDAVAYAQQTPQQWSDLVGAAITQARADLERLAADTAPPTFDNTLGGLEHLWARLQHVWYPFSTWEGSDSSDEMQAVRARHAPDVESLRNSVYQSTALYERTQAAHDHYGSSWDEDQKRVYDAFVRAGADCGVHLPPEGKQRVHKLCETLVDLETEFNARQLTNANVTISVPVSCLTGVNMDVLGDCVRVPGATEEEVLIPVNSAYADPLLEQLTDRATRQRLYEAWSGRGRGATPNDQPTAAILAQMLSTRHELAQVLGHPTHAHRSLANTMAKTTQAVGDLLWSSWAGVSQAVAKDLNELNDYARAQGLNDTLKPWDVAFYTNKLKEDRFGIDMNEVRAYFPLARVRQHAFDAANKVFGVVITPDDTVPTYHPDVVGHRVSKDGQDIGVLLLDDATRATKRPGAWMYQFGSAHDLGGSYAAGVANVLNLPPAPADRPQLLGYDEAVTLFHELGHGLHGLLGHTRYPSQSGTNVDRDFVELPSQLFENWLTNPEALRAVACHWDTGAPMPQEMFDSLLASQKFGQSFFQTAYLQSAIVDLQLHAQAWSHDTPPERVLAVQDEVVASMGAPTLIAPRHQVPHFAHIFGGGYDMGYYSYLWAEVLEADIFTRFTDNGLYDPAAAQAVTSLYQAGGSRDPMALFEDVMGRAPNPNAVLAKWGIATTPRRRPPAP